MLVSLAMGSVLVYLTNYAGAMAFVAKLTGDLGLSKMDVTLTMALFYLESRGVVRKSSTSGRVEVVDSE